MEKKKKKIKKGTRDKKGERDRVVETPSERVNGPRDPIIPETSAHYVCRSGVHLKTKVVSV